MAEASRMNIRVEAENDGRSTRGKPSRMLTLDVIVDWIKYQQLDDYTTKGLIEIASRYPTAGLATFRRNFNLMIQRVRAKRKKEQGGTDYAQETEPQADQKGVEENITLDEAFAKAEFQAQPEEPTK